MNLLKVGAVGTLVAAVCCFTPLLVVVFGVLGLGGLVGYLDYLLLPSLGLFVAILLYALWKRQGVAAK